MYWSVWIKSLPWPGGGKIIVKKVMTVLHQKLRSKSNEVTVVVTIQKKY